MIVGLWGLSKAKKGEETPSECGTGQPIEPAFAPLCDSFAFFAVSFCSDQFARKGREGWRGEAQRNSSRGSLSIREKV